MAVTITLASMHDPAEIESCYEPFSFLRPHLTKDQFMIQVAEQVPEGYRIAYIKDRAQVVSAAGFRIVHYLAWGKVVYIDDLTTSPGSRGNGFAGALLSWLEEHGRSEHCSSMHLDTGYARHDAHRLYLQKGFTLNCHHLSKVLSRPTS